MVRISTTTLEFISYNYKEIISSIKVLEANNVDMPETYVFVME